MIPIVPADVLSKNPLFERIYQDIIKNKLNQDGSSRLSAEAAKQKEEVNKVISTFPFSNTKVKRTSRFRIEANICTRIYRDSLLSVRKL